MTRNSQEILDDTTSFVPCGKCNGEGTYYAKTSGRAGTCFACRGSGRNFTKDAKEELKVSKEINLTAKRAPLLPWIEELKTAAESLPKLPDDCDFDDEGDYYAALDSVPRADLQAGKTRQFLESVASQAFQRGEVTPKQKAAADKVLAKLAEPVKETVPVPTGKVQVTGTVVSTKWVENAYGETEKMVVEDDTGFRVFGTVPRRAKVRDDEKGYIIEGGKEGKYRTLDAGDRVTFVATLEQSRDDEGFGFFKRPTKVKVVD